MNAIVAAAGKVSVSDTRDRLELGKKTHSCPFLYTSRHVEQFDYYHSNKGVIVKPCCSLRPDSPDDFKLGSIDLEKNISAMIGEFDAGRWPRECSVCEREEKEGMISERLRAFESHLGSVKEIENFISNRQIPEFYFHLKFSNLCNLFCRVCNTTESTTYGRIVGAENPQEFTQNDISLHNEWSDLLTLLEKTIIDQTYKKYKLCLVGGETTLSPGIKVLDKWLTEKNLIDKIELVIAANMTHMTDDLLGFFGRFKETTIGMSLDSTYKNFHYVRWPATWEKVTANISRVIEYRKKNNKKIILQPCPNFNINNIFYLDDFLDYWNTHEHDLMIVFNLYSPDIFRVDTLPAYVRPYLIERLKSCLDHDFFKSNKTDRDLIISWLLTVISRLEDYSNVDTARWKRYLASNAEFDYLTETDLFLHNSRLGDLLSAQDKEYYLKCKSRSKIFRITQTPGILFNNQNIEWSKIDNETI